MCCATPSGTGTCRKFFATAHPGPREQPKKSRTHEQIAGQDLLTSQSLNLDFHSVPRSDLLVLTLPQYDEAVFKENKLPTLTNRPAESVVRTISQ